MRKKAVLMIVLALGLFGLSAILAVPQNAASPAKEDSSGAYCALASSQDGDGQAQNPCNPCAKKKAQNPCNPCGKMAGKGASVSVNPCHAKMGSVFYVADPMNRNTVTFKSQAPLEDIVGTTNEISGYVVFDPNQPNKGGRGMLKVPVASLKTGIPLRDEHLQSPDWLNARQFGEIVFEITDVKKIKETKASSGAKTFDLTLVGNLTVHGKTARVETPARVTYLLESPQTKMKLPGNLLAARTSFAVKLSDFGVTGMQGVVGSRVSDSIQIDVSFTGSTAAPGAM